MTSKNSKNLPTHSVARLVRQPVIPINAIYRVQNRLVRPRSDPQFAPSNLRKTLPVRDWARPAFGHQRLRGEFSKASNGGGGDGWAWRY
jgi:phytoene dehydrogenase-like protein